MIDIDREFEGVELAMAVQAPKKAETEKDRLFRVWRKAAEELKNLDAAPLEIYRTPEHQEKVRQAEHRVQLAEIAWIEAR